MTELQSRYLFAHHRTLRDFPGLFPGHPAFGSFEIDESKGDEKFEQMFALARDRAAQGKEIETLYRENILPLPMAAKFGGATVFDVWEAFSANPSLGLKCALGVAGEFDAGRTASLSGITLVDPLTLYGWTQAFLQAGHRPGGISHPEYRQVLAALLERHHRFTQIGNVEVLAELLESGWVINDRLKSFARVMTGPEIDRASVRNLLARLLVNSSRHAPNDSALAAFHREYVAACHSAGRPDDVEEVYGLVAAAAQELLAGSINRATLPPQLMATTNMHSPVSLTLAARKIARGEAGQLFKRLANGGLTLDA